MSTKRKKHFVAAGLLLCLNLSGSFTANAQAYPVKVVKVITPYPGGPSDFVARLIGERLSQVWGQPIIFEPRPGAGGNLGAAAVAQAEPDGYTLLQTSSPPIVINQFLYRTLRFDPAKELSPIVLAATTPLILYVHRSVPVTSLAEFVDYAKKNPGKLSYGSTGIGTSPHLTMEMLMRRTGINLLHVPYRTVPEITTGVIAGRTEVTFGPPSMMEHVANGTIRAIAQTGPRRLPKFTGSVPTMIELGFRDFLSVSWLAFLAPDGTPDTILDKIDGDIRSILGETKIAERIDDLGSDVTGWGRQDFAKFIVEERRRWEQVVRESGAKLD